MSLAEQQWCPTSVQVTALQARGLRAKGKSGTNDAYALLQVGKEKFQTSVVEKSVTPVWKEEATFDLPPLQVRGGGGCERSTLQVQVLHRALVGPDKLLGQAVINLPQLSEDTTRNKTEWFRLLDKQGKPDKDRGEVLLDIQFMRNNMTASMFDLSAAGKSRSRLGKFKDKVRGKKKESDSSSGVVPALTQVMTDSEEEANGDGEEAPKKDGKSKKLKVKSLFSSKSNLQKTMSQSMSVLPVKNSSLSGSQSSGLNVDPSEGKKKFKFKIHKRSGSSDSKDLSFGNQKRPSVEQSNMCINGSHVYCEEPQPRTSRAGSNFSLASSGHGSMEDVPDNSSPSLDSLRAVRQYSPWMEEGEEEEEEEKQEIENQPLREDEAKMEEEERRKKKGEEDILKRQEELKRIIQRKEEKLVEEEKIREEELQRLADKKRKLEEEEKKRREEEKVEEERKAQEEEKRRQEEEFKLAEKIRIEEEERMEELRRQKEEEERIEELRRQKEEEEKIEELRRQKEEEERRQEEEFKLAEKMRLEEERRIEDLRRQKEEEERIEEMRRKEEEDMIRRQKELEEIRRAEQEKIEREEMRRREEILRRQEEEKQKEYERKKREEEEMREKEEEERARKQKEIEEMKREQEERKRKEEEEMLRRQEELERELEEERFRLEDQAREAEKERLKREEEERIRMEEEIQRKEEEKRQREEERRLKELERLRQEEEERMRREEQEMRRREDAERARKEMEENERLTQLRRLEEQKRRQNEEEKKLREEEERKLKEERRAAELISSNPFDEDFSESPFEETPNFSSESQNQSVKEETVKQRCDPALVSEGSCPVSCEETDPIRTQREKRPAPRPPGSDQDGKQRWKSQDVDERAQMNKLNPESDVRTVDVVSARLMKKIPLQNKPPADSKNTQSSTATSDVITAKHAKRPAPSRPQPVSKDSSELKTISPAGKIPQMGATEKEQVLPIHSSNPFEDELSDQEDSSVSAPACWPPALTQTADGDAASQVKLKSSKMARAPAPPAKSDGDDIINKGLADTNDQQRDSTGHLHVNSGPYQDSQHIKTPAKPPSSRRLLPVKPLNPSDQHSNLPFQEDTKSPGIGYELQAKNKVDDTVMTGPYSQLTREELICLVLKQESQLLEKQGKISELEQYIDNLLVRVMEEQPSILMSLSAAPKKVA